MKKIYKIITFTAFIILFSCGKNNVETENTPVPKTPVKVVSVTKGSIDNNITLMGSTTYLKRNLVTAPIPSFITQVNVKLGDKVNKGDLLYVLQSKESRALGTDNPDVAQDLKNFGIISVKASASGIITTLDRQQVGEYVLEGTQLCSIAESSNLAFQVNVPFEYTKYTKNRVGCTITLPDGSSHAAVFTRALTTMNITAQTQTILAKSNHALFLPENMMVQVAVSIKKNSAKQILPKSCVAADEMMKDFWVMKLTNDSTAVKVPVKLGDKNETSVEIVSPVFKKTDKIISEGNYGMPDTALIQVVK